MRSQLRHWVAHRVENEDREPDQSLLAALEAHARIALMPPAAATSQSPTTPATAPTITPNWGGCVEPALVANLGRYRRYDFTSLRDLLRVVRNKRSHYREMPSNLQELLGPLPHGFLKYFSSRFPNLLLAVWAFATQHLPSEPHLAPVYWQLGAEHLHPFLRELKRRHPVPAPAPAPSIPAAQNMSAPPPSPPLPLPPPPPPPPSPGVTGAPLPEGAPPAPPSPYVNTAPATSSSRILAWAGTPLLPTATPTTPPPPATTPPAAPQQVIVGYEVDVQSVAVDGGRGGGPGASVKEFPRRPGKTPCEFFMKTGHCKFGDTCVFDHPEAFAVHLTHLGLPLRPDQPVCAFYLKNNECKFGPSCKFHHPLLRPVYAGSAMQ